MAAALPVLSVAPGGSDSDAPVATPHVSEAAPSTAPANRQAVVLFACRKNAGRSQLSEALFNHYADPALARGISAGSEPIDHVYPEVPVVLQEEGVPYNGHPPKKLTTELTSSASLFITMGCGEACPYAPGLEVQDWQIPDPHGGDLDTFRTTRECIKGLVQALVEQRGWQKADVAAA